MTNGKRGIRALSSAALVLGLLGTVREAHADDATITVGRAPFAEPPSGPAPIAVADDRFIAREPELYRAPFRLTLGPAAITTGKALGYGVGIGADFGTGTVGGRLSASWLRGEGKTDGGASTPTGNSVGQYTGEITLDLHKRGPVHPVIGMGAGLVHVSRPDAQSGFAGVGTGRFAVEYALGFDDADVRVGASVGGGLVGPVADEVRDLSAYAMGGLHVSIGL